MATPGGTPPAVTSGIPTSPEATSAAIASITEGVSVQTLIASFAFGITVNAASAAAFLMAKGRTTSLWKDGQRLALTIFLVSAALWAQIDFVAIAVDPSSASGCRTALAFASAFDQLARVALLQYFLWTSPGAATSAVQRFVPQGLLVGRLVLGGVFVGMQRPQLGPVCVTTTEIIAVPVAIVITDAVLFLACLIRVFSTGGLRDIKDDAGHQKRKGVKLTLGGFLLWTGASIPMHLGISTLDVILGTALPAAALTALIVIITAFSGTLPLNSARPLSLNPEAPSPRNLGTTWDLRDRGLPSRDLSSSGSEYPPSRYEDLKRDDIVSISAFPKPPTREGAPEIPDSGTLMGITQRPPGQGVTGFGGVPVPGQLFPPMRPEMALAERDLQPSEGRADSVRPKKGLFGKGVAVTARGAASAKLAISGPILQGAIGEESPFSKIATIDLATAAKNERERRELSDRPRHSTTLIATRPAPQPPAIRQEDAMRRAQSLKRKNVASAATPSEAGPEPGSADPQTVVKPISTTTSAHLSPGVDELRRRSPQPSPQNAPEMPIQARWPESPPSVPASGRIQGPPRRPARPESLNIGVESQGQVAAPSQIPSPLLMPFESSSPEVSSLPEEISPPQVYSPPQTASSPQAMHRSPPLESTSSRPPVPLSLSDQTRQERDSRMSVFPRNNSVRSNIRPSRRRPPSLEDIPPSPEKPAVQRRAAAGLPGNPRAMAMRQLEDEAKSQRQQTVMFVNNIEYNDPVAVKNILDGAARKATKNSQHTEKEETGASVLNRPRPIPRHKQAEEESVQPTDSEFPRMKVHQRTLSNGSGTSKKSILKAQPGSPTQLPPLPPLPKHPGNQIRPHPNDTKSMTFDEKMDMFFPIPPNGSGGNGPSKSHFSPIPAVPSFPTSFAEADDDFVRDNRTTKTSLQTQSIVEIADIGQPPPLHMLNTAKFSSDSETTTVISQAWFPPVPKTQRPGYPFFYEGAKRQSSPVLPYPVDGMAMLTVDEKSAQPVKHSKEFMTIMLDPSEVQRREVADRESWMADGELAMGQLGDDSDGVKRESQFHQRIGEECPTFSNRKEKTRSRKMVPPTPLLLRGAASKNAVILRAAEPSPLESPWEARQDIKAKLDRLDRSGRDSESEMSEARKQDLLANLEKEMGVQENHWREMHDGLRDSLSTIRTSPTRNSVYESVSRMSRQGQTRRGSSLKPSAVGQIRLRSPTPPDTDDSEDGGITARTTAGQDLELDPPTKAKLWCPTVMASGFTPTKLLWTPPQRPLPQAHGRLNPASVDTSPASKKTRRVSNQALEKIQSTSLWQKSKTPTPSSGYLWGSTAPISKPRPATSRPSRRSRRMTHLPDILESPQPLPDKRDTLGIFQFPWGERSDSAYVNAQSNSILRPMPGTMTSGGPGVRAALGGRSTQVETEEYSSSFFDDYDDDDERSQGLDSELEDDEDFDETTLWEIASLLKTDKVPSKLSLFPSAGEGRRRGETSIIDEYMSSEEGGQQGSIVVALDTNIVPARRASLWAKPGQTRKVSLGLPQPSARAWMQYVAPERAPVRGRPRREDPGPVLSSSLWEPYEPERRYPSLLWGPIIEKGEISWESRSDKSPPKPTIVYAERHTQVVSTSREATPALHRGPTTSLEDWDAALREALAASYPRIKPSFATEREWGAALDEALALSKSSTLSHNSGLWSMPPQQKVRPGKLWQPGQPLHTPAWITPGRAVSHTKRMMAQAERPLPVFLWQNMWRIQDVRKKESKNWLDAAVNKKFRGVEFRY